VIYDAEFAGTFGLDFWWDGKGFIGAQARRNLFSDSVLWTVSQVMHGHAMQRAPH